MWRLQDRPRTVSRFYFVTDGDKDIGYFAATVDDGYWSNPLKTLVVSDYIIKGNDLDMFAGAVSAILEENSDVDLIVAREEKQKPQCTETKWLQLESISV